jgi:hypothetical protein
MQRLRVRSKGPTPFFTVAALVMGVVTIVAVATSIVAVGHAQGRSAATSTVVAAYHPLTSLGSLSSSLHVSARAEGHCSGGGVAGRASYRCLTASSRIEDPCFAATPSGPFYCPVDVVGPNVVEISVRAPAAVTTIEAAHLLWAVELANGQVCIAVNAAWGGLGPLTCSRTRRARPGPLADCRLPVPGSRWWTDSCQAAMSPHVAFKPYRAVEVWR